MPKLTIVPLNEVLEAEDGETLMETAWRHGLYWPTTCGGQGICTSCTCTVDEGAENLEPMGRSELKTLAAELGETVVRERKLRLACQARVRGDVTVTKRGVRPARRSALSVD
jgi:ferredoxin, 2Fe-2S